MFKKKLGVELSEYFGVAMILHGGVWVRLNKSYDGLMFNMKNNVCMTDTYITPILQFVCILESYPYYIIQICSGITSGRVLDGEILSTKILR